MDESTPAGGANTVQVLVPGASYSSVYLAIDRLGSGRSSAPPSAVVTAITQAGAVHQVVTALFGSVAPYSILIDVPVLTVAASQDPVLCGPLATDSPDYHRVVVRRAASMVGT